MGKIIKWFLTVILAGAIPMIIRGGFYILLIDRASFQWLTVSDLISWGLALNIGVLFERKGLFKYYPSIMPKLSIFIILIYFNLYSFSTINEIQLVFDQGILIKATVIFTLLSLLICVIYVIYYPFSGIREKKGKGE